MIERFLHDPVPYVIGISAFIIAATVIGKAAYWVAKTVRNILEVAEYIKYEMETDHGESLKDYAIQNDKQMKDMKRQINRMDKRLGDLIGKENP